MQRNTRGTKTPTASRGSNLYEVAEGLSSVPLKEIAKELITVIELVRQEGIRFEEARLRIVGCKHLIQLLALDKWRQDRLAKPEPVEEE